MQALWPLFIVLMHPTHHRLIAATDWLRPLRCIALLRAYPVQSLKAFPAACVRRLQRELIDFFGRLPPFCKVWSYHARSSV